MSSITEVVQTVKHRRSPSQENQEPVEPPPPLSLSASVNNSREQSPDRGGGLATLFAKPVEASKVTYPPLPLASWVSPSPVSARLAVSIPHLPTFAAWADS